MLVVSGEFDNLQQGNKNVAPSQIHIKILRCHYAIAFCNKRNAKADTA
jgi:hypothetical protein